MDYVEEKITPSKGTLTKNATPVSVKDGSDLPVEGEEQTADRTNHRKDSMSGIGPNKTAVEEVPLTKAIAKAEADDTVFEELRVTYDETLHYLVQGTESIDRTKEDERRAEALLARYAQLHGPLSASANSQLYRVAIIGLGALSSNRLKLRIGLRPN
jgi:hypothetical protein